MSATADGEPRTRFATPTEREHRITSVYPASPARVFDTWTTPEYVRRWFGLASLNTVACDIDLRVGGSWRWVQEAPDGQRMVFAGEYVEIDPPHRLVYTERFDAMADADALLCTLTLTSDAATGTTLTCTSVWPSPEALDQALATGMERGITESHHRLAALLTGLG